jgi:hypothetical protein
MSKLTLSVFTSTQNVRMHDQEIPLLGKEFHLDENGHIIKQSNAILVEGVVESIEINNLHELLDRINNLSPSQAISIGQNKTAINRIVTIEFAKHHPDFRAITRTKEYFEFGASRSIMMLDYDEGKYTMDELRSQLIQLMPDLAHCEMLMIHSSSSCIYKKGDVPPCTIKGGIHTYIIVDQGIHIPQVGERLKYAAWQLGHGYHKITKNGKLLPRHLLDDSVYAPERLIFESFPIIGEGIEIRERQFNYWPGGALSTQNTSLSESERRQLNHTISENRLLYVEESTKSRQTLIKHYTKEFKDRGLNPPEALSSAQKLLNDQVILPTLFKLKNTLGTFSVEEILDDLDAHLMCSFVDPFETETSNEYRAKLYKNDDGSIILHSFRHGGTNFILQESNISWQKALEKHIDEFNHEYAVVLYSSKTFIMKTVYDTSNQKERSFLKRNDFYDLHSNMMIQTSERIHARTQEATPIFKHKAEAWFTHPRRLQYIDGTVFEPATYSNGIERPAVTNEKVLNLWEGYAIEPSHGGSWELLNNHLLNVICSSDLPCYSYLLNWIARCLQRPDLNGQVAVVLKGEKGCGKGTLGNFLVSLFGQHAQHINNASHLIGKFNSHMENCCFLFADEVFFAGDKSQENLLKGLITEPTVMIERKGIDVISATNRLKIMMASNNDWVVPASADERRYFVLDVSNQYRNQPNYFNALNYEIHQPKNQAAFLYDMLHRDISKFTVSQYPDTPALKHQRAQSLNSFGKYWLEALERGYLYQSGETLNQSLLSVWHDIASNELINCGYEQWCQINKIGQYHILSKNMIGKLLSSCYDKKYLSDRNIILGENKKGEIVYNRTRAHCYILGAWEQAVSVFCDVQKLDATDLLENIALQKEDIFHDYNINHLLEYE